MSCSPQLLVFNNSPTFAHGQKDVVETSHPIFNTNIENNLHVQKDAVVTAHPVFNTNMENNLHVQKDAVETTHPIFNTTMENNLHVQKVVVETTHSILNTNMENNIHVQKDVVVTTHPTLNTNMENNLYPQRNIDSHTNYAQWTCKTTTLNGGVEGYLMTEPMIISGDLSSIQSTKTQFLASTLSKSHMPTAFRDHCLSLHMTKSITTSAVHRADQFVFINSVIT